MAQGGHSELFKVMVGQVSQDGKVDVILSKALSVLPETEIFEPVRNLLHHGHLADFSLSALPATPRVYPTRFKIEGISCRRPRSCSPTRSDGDQSNKANALGLMFRLNLLAIANEVIE
jgi:hypothetical protein